MGDAEKAKDIVVWQCLALEESCCRPVWHSMGTKRTPTIRQKLKVWC